MTVLALLAATAASASAAAPRIVIFSGKPLAQRIVIDDWQRIFRFYVPANTTNTIRGAQLAARPHLRVSLFWGPRWIDYLAKGNDARTLWPSQADQNAVFYPSWQGQPALFQIPSMQRRPHPVPAMALAVLQSYGVPVSSR
jgi:hypothetical protein